jgi:CDP-paratose 2-epimerase
MRILVTGACGFVGSTIAAHLAPSHDVVGFDNLWRPGSERNRSRLRELGVKVVHGDVRAASDFEPIGDVDGVIDAAANASVLAGVDGATTSRQLIEHNLLGTVNILEFCRAKRAMLVLLSTSRVYSINALQSIALRRGPDAFVLDEGFARVGLSAAGISEDFPVGAPASLYGTTKFASEQLAGEYSSAFDVPVWINRCGVLAGAGQFGQPAQGIFSWWINRWQKQRPLAYLGFGGEGLQVRDCLHPSDLCVLIERQLDETPANGESNVFNVSGGAQSAISLAQLSAWCTQRFGPLPVACDGRERAFDVPWVVLDSTRAKVRWNWSPTKSSQDILAEIADHAESNRDWLELSAP